MTKTIDLALLRTLYARADLGELLPRSIVAAGIGYSVSWLEQKAYHGGGPPMVKIGRRCLYYKQAVEDWLLANSRSIRHTSELAMAA